MLSVKDVLEIIAPIRERLAVLEADVSALKARPIGTTPAPASSTDWLSLLGHLPALLKFLPWIVGLGLVALGHVQADELKAWLFGARPPPG